MSEHIDKIKLTAFFTDDLPSSEAAKVQVHVSTCVVCRQYLKQLQQEQDAFLHQHPLENLNLPSTRIPKHRFGFRQVFAVAAALVLSVSAGYYYYTMTRSQVQFRIKGEVGIAIYVKSQKGEPEARTDSVYYPGEYIQFSYSCAATNYLILLSIDENGKVSPYYPIDSDSSIVLQKGQDIPLPNSILLDQYIGKELFVAIFSQQKLSLSQQIDQLRVAFKNVSNLQKLDLEHGAGIEVKSILIIKARPEQ